MRGPSCTTGERLSPVVLASDDVGRLTVVVHPAGVTALTGQEPDGVVLAGSHRVADAVVTWAWGHVRADQPTPHVWFQSRWALLERPGWVRRLSATVWAAQVPGRWRHVRIT